jgi:hypothetical protein
LHRLNVYCILPLLYGNLHLYSDLEVWYLQCSIYNVYIIFIYWLKALPLYILLHICKLNWYITEESSLQILWYYRQERQIEVCLI